MRVATRSRNARSWVTKIAAGWRASRFSSARMPSMSRWLVGSSSSSTSGSCAKAAASAARLRSPREARAIEERQVAIGELGVGEGQERHAEKQVQRQKYYVLSTEFSRVPILRRR